MYYVILCFRVRCTTEAFVVNARVRPPPDRPELERRRKKFAQSIDFLKIGERQTKNANSLLEEKTGRVFVTRRSFALPIPLSPSIGAASRATEAILYTIVVDRFIFLRFSSRRAAIATGMEDPRRRESRIFFRTLVSPPSPRPTVDGVHTRGVRVRVVSDERITHHERSAKSAGIII